tara:strand:- start:3195 stop:6503 length:3309 start_codon:yes stop_codon:yes gene_type:complete
MGISFRLTVLLSSSALLFGSLLVADQKAFEDEIRPILAKRCYGCHGPEKQKGKLRLDQLDPDMVNGNAAETWHDALNQLNLGEMPPEDEPQPTPSERTTLTQWLNAELKRAAKARNKTGGQAVLRRLNRAEYQHTMTDLLGFEMDYSENLPSDARSGEGFKNNGAYLGMTALQVESYLNTARKALDFILVEGEQEKREVAAINRNNGGMKGPNSRRFSGLSSERLGRVNFWHGSFNGLPRTGKFTIRVKASTDRKPGQPAPILYAQYGYFVSGLTLNIMEDAGEIAVTSSDPKYYDISGWPEFFPKPEARVPDDKLSGIIALQNALYDGEEPPQAINKEIEEELNAEATREKVAKWEKALAELVAQRELFEKEELPDRFEQWLQKLPTKAPAPPDWATLGNAEPKSLEGATFVPQQDGSFLLSGQNPKSDRWVVTAKVDLPSVRAIRIEALTDKSLKKNGPGRAGNGNFVLSDLRVFAKPIGAEGKGKQVKLINPRSDLLQDNKKFSAALAIDDNPRDTGWGSGNRVGQDHACLFEFAEAVEHKDGMVFTLELDYLNKNASHVIGRPRFSVSSSLLPQLDGQSSSMAWISLLDAVENLGGVESLDEKQRQDLVPKFRYVDSKWVSLTTKLFAYEARKPQPRIRKKKAKVYPEDPDFPRIIIESVEFVRNDYPSWPPPLHRRIIREGEDLSDPEAVTSILSRFLRRAWRRPVSEEEVKTWQTHFEVISKQSDTPVSALKETLSAALASSHFLYLSEPLTSDKPRKLNAHELAARLSYFLWSSMPDEELSALADSGRLLDPKVLGLQFERMLADAKADRFADQFSMQWLDLEGVDRVAINPQYYKSFDNNLKPDMVGETQAFFREILRSNSSALQFLDADFTMLNATLAKHYGLSGPKSQFFERVSLKGTNRPGGLLGHASTLLAGSDGADSHPIKRAVWIREHLLHDPPNPPPPDVPELAKSVPDFEKLSIREQLKIHREKAACAECHRSIDPWGIALERYDAIGLPREKTATQKQPVASDAVLPGNHPVSGLAGLQKYLLNERRDQFAHALVSKMLIYALGRDLEFGDHPLIEELSRSFAQNGYRLPALMANIAKSQPFLSR